MLNDAGEFEDDKIYESREINTPPVYEELASAKLHTHQHAMHHAMTQPMDPGLARESPVFKNNHLEAAKRLQSPIKEEEVGNDLVMKRTLDTKHMTFNQDSEGEHFIA